ncbi:MAG TPA: DUF1631 family protein [Casimicrobium sp.]|nr:DUF1631 family protein [Casimicrobium sp.]
MNLQIQVDSPQSEPKATAAPAQAVLNACRDLMQHRCSLQLAAAFDRLSDMLMENASKSYEPKVVNGLLDARSALLRTRGSMAETFTEELTARLDGKKPCVIPGAALPQTGSLSLQTDEVLDEYVSARSLARSIESACLGELPSLHQNIAYLKRIPTLKMEDDPFSPQSIVGALLQAMLVDSATTVEMRLHWIRGLSQLGGMGFNDVYADLNRYLKDCGVQAPRSAAQHRGGGSAQAGHAEAGQSQQGMQHAGPSPSAADGGGYGFAAQSADGYMGAGYPSDANMRPDAAPLQQLANNLVALVERLQHVVPAISGGPASSDPSLSGMVRNKEAMQISAALGFAANGAFRAPLSAGVDRRLLDSLTDLQLRADQIDFSSPPQPARTVLREVVPGYASGEISVLDATTTELVAMMFDFVLARKELRDEIKVLLGRLQIPMLKAAMVDRGFFSRKNHPARQLLNRLADAGIGWSPEDGVHDELFLKIRDLVEHISSDFVDDLGFFTAALVELEQFIAEQEINAKSTVEDETAEAQAADTHLAAVREAKETVDARIRQNALPEPVIEFIEVAWQPHLQDALLDGGKESPQYEKAVAVLDELVWSVTPKDQPAERTLLSQRVPSLVRRLREGLKSLSDDTVTPFFDRLLEVHAGLLRGAKPEYVEPTELPDASNDIAFDPFGELVKQMERNQWIEMSDEKGALKYAKLAWVSPQGTTYLFTTRHGRKAASLTPEELAEWFRTDKARLIEAEPIVDRALAGMFQTA